MPITCTVTGPACTRKVRDGRRATSKCAPPASSSKRMSASDSIALSSTVVGPSGTTREPSARTICASALEACRTGDGDGADAAMRSGPVPSARQPTNASTAAAAHAAASAGMRLRRWPSRRDDTAHRHVCVRLGVSAGALRRAAASVRSRSRAPSPLSSPWPALLSHDRALPSPPAGHERSSAWPSVLNSRTVWPRLRFALPRGSGGSRRCARSRPRPRAPRGPP